MPAPDVTVAALRSAVAGDFAELGGRLGKLEHTVAEIHQALTGNGLGVHQGIVGCLHHLEACAETQSERVAQIERRWDRLKWAVIGIALGSGVGGGGLVFGLLRAVGG